MDTIRLKRLQGKRLSRLVRYAREHSPLFNELYRGVDMQNIALERLPVTGKKELSDRLDDWFTDRRLNRRMIESFLEHRQDGLLLDAYTAITTSGSSDTPLIMVRDAFHNTIHGALMQIRLMRGLDANLLNPANHRIALVIFTSGHCSSDSSFLKFREKHSAFTHNTMVVSTLESIPAIVGKLNDFAPDVLTGYPSVLVGLAREQLAGRLHLDLRVVACSAETLTDEHYRYLKEAFRCPVCNNYCSMEGGELAMSCSEGRLHLNADWVIVEPVDEFGAPCREGEVSAGVLITDLTNFVQPVVRYFVSDHARIGGEPCPCGCGLPTIEIMGRLNDSFTWNGITVGSVSLACRMPEIQGLQDYQFVQCDEGSVRFHYEAAPGVDVSGIIHEVRDRFDRFLTANGGQGTAA